MAKRIFPVWQVWGTPSSRFLRETSGRLFKNHQFGGNRQFRKPQFASCQPRNCYLDLNQAPKRTGPGWQCGHQPFSARNTESVPKGGVFYGGRGRSPRRARSSFVALMEFAHGAKIPGHSSAVFLWMGSFMAGGVGHHAGHGRPSFAHCAKIPGHSSTVAAETGQLAVSSFGNVRHLARLLRARCRFSGVATGAQQRLRVEA
jgi:hypothetical protein